jgi:hypothetical protein
MAKPKLNMATYTEKSENRTEELEISVFVPKKLFPSNIDHTDLGFDVQHIGLIFKCVIIKKATRKWKVLSSE